MKCSEYLWKYMETMEELEGVSPEQAQGELRLKLGKDQIVSDTDGAELSEREAMSVLGRNEKELWEAFGDGDQERFAAIVTGQQTSDDEWHAEKEAQENVDPGFSVDPDQEPQADGEAGG